MNIGIIGTGRMGGGLARRWARAGHNVMLGSRDPEKAKAMAAEFGALGGSQAEAAAFGEVVLLATPWSAAEAVVKGLALDGKILIECTNDLSPTRNESTIGTAQQIAAWAPGAKVVKAFNTVFWQIIHAEPSAERGTVFIVGDDKDAKNTVATLIQDAGFEPFDAGTLANAHYIDTLAGFIVQLGYGEGAGTNISYKLVRL